MRDLFILRSAQPEDANFILNSWLMSYRHSPFAKGVLKDVYFKKHHEFVRNAIGRSAVFCAVSKEDSSQIYGWVCIEPPTGHELTRALHYVYVKHPYRGFGIGRALLSHVLDKEPKFAYTHIPTGKLIGALTERGNYDPYRFFKESAA